MARRRRPPTDSNPRREPGRPRLVEVGWDPERAVWDGNSPVGRMMAALRVGNYLKASAEYGGIAERTIHAWLARGREHTPADDTDDPDFAAVDPDVLAYVHLVHAVSKAEVSAEVELVTIWRAAAREDWRAARDLLARRHPDRWRERQTIDVPGDPDAAEAPLTGEELLAAVADHPEVLDLMDRLSGVLELPE